MSKYVKFSCQSMKARISWAQDKLIKLGYLQENESAFAKRDKAFIKFQADNGFTTNAEIHEKEFEILSKI